MLQYRTNTGEQRKPTFEQFGELSAPQISFSKGGIMQPVLAECFDYLH